MGLVLARGRNKKIKYIYIIFIIYNKLNAYKKSPSSVVRNSLPENENLLKTYRLN